MKHLIPLWFLVYVIGLLPTLLEAGYNGLKSDPSVSAELPVEAR